jgi:hypothetical protein
VWFLINQSVLFVSLQQVSGNLSLDNYIRLPLQRAPRYVALSLEIDLATESDDGRKLLASRAAAALADSWAAAQARRPKARAAQLAGSSSSLPSALSSSSSSVLSSSSSSSSSSSLTSALSRSAVLPKAAAVSSSQLSHSASGMPFVPKKMKDKDPSELIKLTKHRGSDDSVEQFSPRALNGAPPNTPQSTRLATNKVVFPFFFCRFF